MKHRLIAGVLAAIVPSSVAAAELSARRTLRESHALPTAQATRLMVDNLHGSIVVRGVDGNRLEVVAEETVFARSEDRLARAREEVRLQVFQRAGEVELFVDGPFRDKSGRHRWAEHRDPGYRVVYDFDIRVPRDTELEIRTVNEGDIRVEDVRGSFQVHNINGSIRLERMEGSGEAVTVNGPVVVRFASNPTADSRFETVNGQIDVSFRAGLSADLELQSRWGELWSEYPIEPLPAPPPTTRIEGGRSVIEVAGSTRLRVAAGGPTHSFETLNGNIYVRRWGGQER